MSADINPFYEGQHVVCIDDTRFVALTNSKHLTKGELPTNKPKKDEVLVIDEIMGEFLRFEKYDFPDEFNWWHYKFFAPIEDADYIDEQIEDLINVEEEELNLLNI